MPELALLGGSKTKQKPFPLWPQYDDNERRALEEVLESRVWWRTPGTKTLEFEQALLELSQMALWHAPALTAARLVPKTPPREIRSEY